MEDKKYEAGRVEITSEEYRDLVTEAVMARRDASEARSDKWRVESERDKIAKELELANKKIAELEMTIRSLQTSYPHIGSTPIPLNDIPKPWWSEVTCQSASKVKEDY